MTYKCVSEEEAMKLKTLMILTSLLASQNITANDNQFVQLITPTLWAQKPQYFACNLTNVSDKSHTIQVRIISNGDILLESGEVDVEPRYTANYYIQGLGGRGGPLYCEFTVEGSKEWYRGAAKLFPGKNHPTTDLVAIPAE